MAGILLAIPQRPIKEATYMKAILFIAAALGLVFGYSACERQSWEETRKLHLDKHEGEAAHEGGEKKAH